MCALRGHLNACAMCACAVCACVCVRAYVHELTKQKRTDVPLENIFHTCAHLRKFPARQSKSMAASADISKHVQQACHQSQPSAISATPAMQSDDPCHQVPRLPRKNAASTASTGTRARHQSQPSAINATPATQSGDPCRQVPRLPRKEPRRPRRQLGPERATREPSAINAPPATQSGDPCRQVPRLPRKEPRRPQRQLGPKRATRASPVLQVPRLPRKVTIHVAKCHACHANSRVVTSCVCV